MRRTCFGACSEHRYKDMADEPQRISDDLRKVLNRNGYGFRYAVLRRFEQLSKQKKGEWVWRRPTPEFPVIAGPSGAETTCHNDLFAFSGVPQRCRMIPAWLAINMTWW